MAIKATIPAALLAATIAIESELLAYSAGSQSQKSYVIAKRLFDLFLASLALIVALPLLLVSCLAIMLETRGSPIFRQKRVGLQGQTFEMFKLRTMRSGTEYLSCRTLANDPRVTRVGSFLRATSLDELPQLVNIVAGEMSIIGPRPLSSTETEDLVARGFDPHQPGLKPKVKPGLIGLEQVNRARSLSFNERFRLNSLYESQFGFNCDMEIFTRALCQCWQVCTLVSVAGAAECLMWCLK